MSKIKFDERIGRTIDAFFETQPDRSEFAMTYTIGDSAMMLEKPTVTEKADKWSRVLREILLFGPGTILLYYMTLGTVEMYPEMGLHPGELIWVSALSFIVYAGSGHLKQTRNLAVPATVIVFGLFVAFYASIFPNPGPRTLFPSYAIYLVPNVLIAAKLVQTWLLKKK